MKKDKIGGDSNADGTQSTVYCSLCYQDGAFLHPDFSAEQMQRHCIAQLKQQGMPEFLGWIFTRGIPKLDRWTGKAGS